MTDPIAELVDQLRLERRAQCVTHAGVAEAVGVTPAAIAGWEKHRDHPSPGSLYLWALALRRTLRLVDQDGRWLSPRPAPLVGETPERYWLRCTVLGLRDLRNEAGMTQAQVAERLCVSAWCVQMREKGERTPSLADLVAWCAVFGCHLELRRR